MKRLLMAVGVLAVAACVQASVVQVDLWNGLLTGDQGAPPSGSAAQGGEFGFGISYNEDSNQLLLNVVYGTFGWSGLEGDFLSAGLFAGGIGETGPLVVDLTPLHISFNSLNPTYGCFLQGAVLIPQEYETALLQGGLYMSIASSKYPWGEIRGQLVIPEPASITLLGLGLGGLFFLRRARS